MAAGNVIGKMIGLYFRVSFYIPIVLYLIDFYRIKYKNKKSSIEIFTISLFVLISILAIFLLIGTQELIFAIIIIIWFILQLKLNIEKLKTNNAKLDIANALLMIVPIVLLIITDVFFTN